MTSEYTQDDLLPLSGIQHFLFCRRQWALIHVERQWQENALTAEGRIMHQRVDDPFFTETRNGIITARSVLARIGWLYYGETRHRVEVDFLDSLMNRTRRVVRRDRLLPITSLEAWEQ